MLRMIEAFFDTNGPCNRNFVNFLDNTRVRGVLLRNGFIFNAGKYGKTIFFPHILLIFQTQFSPLSLSLSLSLFKKYPIRMSNFLMKNIAEK